MRQKESSYRKEKYSYYLLNIPLIISVGIFTGGLGFFAEQAISIAISVIIAKLIHKCMNNEEKDEFILNNILIIDNIQNKLLDFVEEQLDKNLLKEKIKNSKRKLAKYIISW